MIEIKGLEFRLHLKEATYAFHVNGAGKLIADYFGPLLSPDIPLESVHRPHNTPGGTNIVYDEGHDKAFTMDFEPFEFSSIGKGDFSSTPVLLYDEEKGYVQDFVYVGHEIKEGVYQLEDFPAPHGEAETLIVHLQDRRKTIAVDLIYVLFSEATTILRTTKITNLNSEKVTIERAASYSRDFFLDSYDLYTLQGTWGSEAGLVIDEIKPGKRYFASHLGLSSNRVNPFFLLREKAGTLETGSVYSFNLIYSSSHFYSVETSTAHRTRVMAGLDDEAFHYDLKKGESFVTPYGVLSYSNHGLNGAMANNHRFVIDHVIPERFRDYPRKILLNNWEATYFKFDEGKIMELARDAKKLGIELFVLDDGWFKKRDDDTTSLGDFECDKKKIPSGIEGLAKKIKGLDLSFGLWVEPEAISEDSDLYRAHPDYVVASPDLVPSKARHQWVLDLSKDEVVDHILDELRKILGCGLVSYIKWDMNRPLSDYPPSPHFCLDYAKGLYRLIKTITAEFPDVYFQGCASGGNRFDLGILSYFPEIWASDNTDPISRLTIQGNLALGYPPRCMGAHVAASPSHQTLRKTSLATRFDCALFGGFGYEFSTRDLTPLERKEVKAQIQYYKEHRKVFQDGQFSLLNDPTIPSKTVDLEVRLGDEAFVASFRLFQDTLPSLPFLKATGLKDDQLYRIDSRPLTIDIKTFGGLINMISPVRLNPSGSLVDLISRHKGIPADVVSMIANGKLLNDGLVPLHHEWNGTGLEETTAVRGDYGSRLYHIYPLSPEVKKDCKDEGPSL